MPSSSCQEYGHTKTRIIPADLPAPNNGEASSSRTHKIIVLYACNHIASSFSRYCPGNEECPCNDGLRPGHRSPLPCNECRWIDYPNAVEDKVCVIQQFKGPEGQYLGFKHDFCGAHPVDQPCMKPYVEVWETNPGWKKHALCALTDPDSGLIDARSQGETVDVLEPLTKLSELTMGTACRCGLESSELTEDPRCRCNIL